MPSTTYTRNYRRRHGSARAGYTPRMLRLFAAAAGLAFLLSACGTSTGTSSEFDAQVPPQPDLPPDTTPPTFTRLHVYIVDSKTQKPIPGMVTLFDAAGKPAECPDDWVHFGRRVDEGTPTMGATVQEVGSGGALATYHGLAIWRGFATIPVGVDLGGIGCEPGGTCCNRYKKLPHGTYRLVAHRGIEYEVSEATVDLSPNRGEVTVVLPLAHTVDTTGYLAADMHVHSAPGSGDSRINGRDRLKSMVVNGVEVVVASDHDFITDLGDAARALWPAGGDPAPLVTIVGTEASFAESTQVLNRPWRSGHFNAFPLLASSGKPRAGAPDPFTLPVRSKDYFALLRGLPGPSPIVQMNHTRLSGGLGYFSQNLCGPWTDRQRLPNCSVEVDSMEVLGGYMVCGTLIGQLLADWYALLNFGVVVTAVGNSDTHGTVNLLGGYPRTYVRVNDDRPAAFSQDEYMAALRGHRAIATSGPFLTLRVNDAQEGAVLAETTGRVRVSIRMQAVSWVIVDEVRLLVNGAVVQTWLVPKVGTATPLLDVVDEPVLVGADAFITAEASGAKPLPPFLVGEWTSVSAYACAPSPGSEPGFVPFAVTNPVFIDVDGDGKFRGPRQPAVFPVPPN